MSQTDVSGKIMVVEDNDFVRMQIVRYLESADYMVNDYSEAREAAGHIKENFDLVVLDVRMEPMGGFDFLKHMRSQDIDTEVILVTGDQDPNMLSEASRWGVAAVLMKPVQKDRLLKTIEKSLTHRSRKEG